jgi:acetyl esterase/lipase
LSVDRTPIHPELRRIAALLPRGVGGPNALRFFRRLESLQQLRRAPPETQLAIIGAAAIRVHYPPDRDGPYPALLWIHGGGYVMGTPAQDDTLCRRIARQLGVIVAAVDYRRAPEHPFPAALHDCHDALMWLATRGDVDAARIAIGGASAGGGLAAALALLARERGMVRPVLQLLSYPMLDDRTVLRTDIDERCFRLWNSPANAFGWRSYLDCEPGSPEVSALAAPARNEDYARLPPAWIGVGTCDLFYDEDLAYAHRLQGAGVPCEVHVVDGAFHGFDSVRPRAAITSRYREAQVRTLAAALCID